MANLILIAATLASWYILGKWLGRGYCPVTAWHWKIRRKMGASIPDSYIKLVIDAVTGKEVSASYVNALTLIATLASGITSVVLNIVDYVR